MKVKIVLSVISFLLLSASTLFAPAPRYFAVNYETKECGGYWPGDEFVTYELPSGWVAYEHVYDTGYFYVETEVGICRVAQYVEASVDEACCSQLGYSYISENVGVSTLTQFNMDNQKAWEQEEAERSARAQALEREKRIQTIGRIILITVMVILPSLIIGLRYYSRKK